MRLAGAFALLIVFVTVAETRPSREKRGIKICSARDVKFMATFVCNLHKRTARSISDNDAQFSLPSMAWLAESGYTPTADDDNILARVTENYRPRIYTKDFEIQKEDIINLLEKEFSNLRGPAAKRNNGIDWPLVTSMTLGDIRRNCCIRQCRVEDFYGACS